MFAVLGDNFRIKWCGLRRVKTWSKKSIFKSLISAGSFFQNVMQNTRTRRLKPQLDYCPAATDDYRLQTHVVVVIFKGGGAVVYDNATSFEVKGNNSQPRHIFTNLAPCCLK